MNAQIRKLYAKFRAHSPFMLVGENAKQALDAAHIYAKFQKLVDQGRVRLNIEREQEPDDSFFDTYGRRLSERSKQKAKEQYRANCWRISTDYLDADGEWQPADSIGNCDGEYRQQNAFDNPYVIDLMRSAVEAIRDIDSERTESILAQCRESARCVGACSQTVEFN